MWFTAGRRMRWPPSWEPSGQKRPNIGRHGNTARNRLWPDAPVVAGQWGDIPGYVGRRSLRGRPFLCFHYFCPPVSAGIRVCDGMFFYMCGLRAHSCASVLGSRRFAPRPGAGSVLGFAGGEKDEGYRRPESQLTAPKCDDASSISYALATHKVRGGKLPAASEQGSHSHGRQVCDHRRDGQQRSSYRTSSAGLDQSFVGLGFFRCYCTANGMRRSCGKKSWSEPCFPWAVLLHAHTASRHVVVTGLPPAPGVPAILARVRVLARRMPRVATAFAQR